MKRIEFTFHGSEEAINVSRLKTLRHFFTLKIIHQCVNRDLLGNDDFSLEPCTSYS